MLHAPLLASITSCSIAARACAAFAAADGPVRQAAAPGCGHSQALAVVYGQRLWPRLCRRCDAVCHAPESGALSLGLLEQLSAPLLPRGAALAVSCASENGRWMKYLMEGCRSAD